MLKNEWISLSYNVSDHDYSNQNLFSFMVVVVLPNPFRKMGAWKNSTETQQSGHAPRSRPGVKNGRSGAEDGAPERLGCRTVKEEEISQILQRVSAGAA